MLLEPDRFRHTPVAAPERTEAPKPQQTGATRPSDTPAERDKVRSERGSQDAR